MSNDREILRRALRVAAQVAAVGGFVAAGAGMSRASEIPHERAPLVAGDNARASDDSAFTRLTEALRVTPREGNCGCAPCWGPPAPPAMILEVPA